MSFLSFRSLLCFILCLAANACSPCAPGAFCSGSACAPCSAGFYCPGGSAQPVACLAPTLCPVSGLYAEPIFWNVTTIAGSDPTPFAD